MKKFRSKPWPTWLQRQTTVVESQTLRTDAASWPFWKITTTKTWSISQTTSSAPAVNTTYQMMAKERTTSISSKKSFLLTTGQKCSVFTTMPILHRRSIKLIWSLKRPCLYNPEPPTKRAKLRTRSLLKHAKALLRGCRKTWTTISQQRNTKSCTKSPWILCFIRRFSVLTDF